MKGPAGCDQVVQPSKKSVGIHQNRRLEAALRAQRQALIRFWWIMQRETDCSPAIIRCWRRSCQANNQKNPLRLREDWTRRSRKAGRLRPAHCVPPHHPTFAARLSRNPFNCFLCTGCCNFLTALASIWRTRSRANLKMRPSSSKSHVGWHSGIQGNGESDVRMFAR